MENKYKKLITWGIAAVVSLITILVVYFLRINNPPYGMAEMPVMQAVSDGFFVTGLIFTGFGLLLWISTTGVLDIITYGFKSLLYLFTPYQKSKDEGGFYEYKLEKAAKRKAVPFEYLWLGLGWIVVSFILALFV
jgi:hypothetical protein